MPIQITVMRESDIEGAVTCIQEAFADDPYSRWIFDTPSTFNPSRNRASLRTRCRWGMRYAIFHVAKDTSTSTPDRVLGVACWLAPNLATLAAPTTWSDWFTLQISSWSLWSYQVLTNTWYLGRGGLNVRRYWIWKAAQASAQSSLWDDARGYYFCNIVTVLPEAQGKGIGRMMVDTVTAVADREGRECYLESSRDKPNVPIYEKMGFRLCKEMECRDGAQDPGISLYCMKRSPQLVTNQ
ncbi:hypothetical protein FH972_024680 [Carpinus fangiana]|uniref:N-acetyltransferase domain-containing protein n=1 Tax=Carpinus fangiana TaxID=176857 RepID=A0A5N6KYP4_9ROSI|nr:hypothetical protein FH972_024680 [Carpinus fangiana]